MKIKGYYDIDKLISEDNKCYRYVIRQQSRQTKELLYMVPRYAITDIRYANGCYAYGVIDNIDGTIIEVFDHEYKADKCVNDMTKQAKINGEPLVVHVIENRHGEIIRRYPVNNKGVD